MKDNLNVIVFGDKELAKKVKPYAGSVYFAPDLKALVRGHVEKDFDAVFCVQDAIAKDKIYKIFKTYKKPFFLVTDNKSTNAKALSEKGQYFITPKDIESWQDDHRQDLEILSVESENLKLNFLLEVVKEFEITVEHVGKDMFISEVKSFFKSQIKTKQPFWLDIPKSLLKLPPILRCKQQLETQKVAMGAIINDLDECVHEIISTENFQVWKRKKGKYLALIWLDGEHSQSNCLILNDIRFDTVEKLQAMLEQIVPIIRRRWKISLAVADAQEEVYKDSLTNLYNQKFLNEVLERKIEEERRYKTPFSILFIDIDFFKKVNDTKGHVVGSQILRELGVLIEDCIRGADYAFRYGGDEFIILLGHTEGEQAEHVAERVRQKVEAATFNQKDQPVNITVSIGIACYPKHAKSAQEIIQIADEAMYYGKSQSRNVVYQAS